MENQMTKFKRLNFFTGFFTTAEDWNDGESYHLEKRRLHNRALHRPGILAGVGEELAVAPVGGRVVEVKRGAALDGLGNLMWLDAAHSLEIKPAADVGQTAYITVTFAEQDDGYVEDPDFGGFTRKLESPRVQCSFSAPDGVTEIELARITLLAGATDIQTPDNPAEPHANQIDRTHALYAGASDPYFGAVVARVIALHHAVSAQQRRHNLGLHTPGVLRHVAQELLVRPLGGLTVRVEPGAMLDGQGNELYLDAPVDLTLSAAPDQETIHFVTATYRDPYGATLHDLNRPFPDTPRTALIALATALPDEISVMQLARIVLSAGASAIKAADDPDQPQTDEIDLTARRWSAARKLAPERLTVELRKRVNTIMLDARENFAALGARFATPSIEDVRTAALQVRLMAGALSPDQLPRILHVIADLEQDVSEELAARFPPLATKSEYRAYQNAVAALLAALAQHGPVETLLNDQAAVNSTVRDLAEVSFPPPVANAGPDQTAPTPGNHAIVELDGSGSTAAEGQRIVRYIWKETDL